MTGSQTEQVSTKAYLVAVSALLRVAKALFDRGMRSENPTYTEDAALAHWFVLRRVAQTWLANQSTATNVLLREEMVGALRFAHGLAHEDGSTVGRVESCGCAMAAQLRELASLQIADAVGLGVSDAA